MAFPSPFFKKDFLCKFESIEQFNVIFFEFSNSLVGDLLISLNPKQVPDYFLEGCHLVV